MRVLNCITHQHDIRLVLLALLVCLAGCGATAQLFKRIQATTSWTRSGWLMLCAVATGTTIWCTHFVAMMAYVAEETVALDPLLTLLSLGIAIGFTIPGLTIAARSHGRYSGLIGGAIVGIAISTMHYAGMRAYHVDGVVRWDRAYVLASVVLSSVIAAAAFHLLRRKRPASVVVGALLLGIAVAVLHFTGMTAFTVIAVKIHGGLSPQDEATLAISTALAGLLVLVCAGISALIDGRTQHDNHRRIRRMVLHDALTDLPSRLSFTEELHARLKRRGGPPRLAVVMFDVARLKHVNDSYGLEAGDQLLVALAARMSQMLQPGEMIARLGSDEFAALVSYDKRAEVDAFLARIADIFAKPFAFERFNASVGVRIGVALAPRDGRNADTLLTNADLALFRAKSLRSTEACFYHAEMDAAMRDRRELADDLRAAIRLNAFELHYQVQASTRTNEICGYEVLLRWRHPTRGLVPPSLFIPLAEEIGEIVHLSNWVLAQACEEAAHWSEPHPIAVNLSPLQLSDPKLVETVANAIASSGLPAGRLALELTESAIIRDRQYALGQLRALKAMGISLALDDFGVGYSSLDVLRSFPFDRIKLDASFVAEIEENPQALSILRAVTTLGSLLGIPLLAEGIETAAQLEIVAREGCSSVQGYFIGRPARTLIDAETVRAAMQPCEVSPPTVILVAQRNASDEAPALEFDDRHDPVRAA